MIFNIMIFKTVSR